MRRPLHRLTLFWRIYLYGVLLLVGVVLVTVVSLRWIEEVPPEHRIPGRVAHRFGELLREEPPDLGKVQHLMDDLAELSDLSMAIYGPEGDGVAFAGPDRLLPLPPEEVEPLRPRRLFHQGNLLVMALPLGPGREGEPAGYLLIGNPRSHRPLTIVIILTGIFLLLGFMPWVLAHQISRPLSRMQDVSAEWAKGRLKARTGILRSDEVGDLARAFDHMADRLEQLIRSERELLANISHEIRTPLSRIRVALELVEEGGLNEAESRAHLGGIAADLEELERLIGEILLTARLEQTDDNASGTLPLRRERLDPAEILDESIRRFTERHPGRTLSRVLPEAPLRLKGDRVLLRRFLDNLLDNAAAHASPEASIELGGRKEGDRIVLWVRDTGPGVSDEDLPRLFEPFFRADRSRSSSKGIGLGLTLCQRIVAAHGGEIRAQKADGGGLIVVGRLPADDEGIPD